MVRVVSTEFLGDCLSANELADGLPMNEQVSKPRKKRKGTKRKIKLQETEKEIGYQYTPVTFKKVRRSK